MSAQISFVIARYGLRFTTDLLQKTPDMINRGPGAYSGIVFIGKIKNAIKSIVDY